VPYIKRQQNRQHKELDVGQSTQPASLVYGRNVAKVGILMLVGNQTGSTVVT
jgi:hypothetical protein